jgi:serine/threonine-protein kinase
MPYVAGGTLRERMKCQRRLPVKNAVLITKAVARALDYTHRHNVIHRDIKPENILLENGHAYVFDFGIAQARSNGRSGEDVPQHWSCSGTPHYMSPEQASGETLLDGRSDLYSLACVLYEMLAGQPPFTGSDQAVMAKHIAEPVVPLSTLRPIVGRTLCAAVTRALAKSPAERFETVLAFAVALGTGSENEHVRHAPVPHPRALA